MARCCSGPSIYEATQSAEEDAAAAEAALEEMQDIIDATPGIELGFAERTTNFSTTATALGASADITGLSVTVIGQGRPVDVMLVLPGVYHSVTNTTVFGYISVGGVAAPQGTTGGSGGPSTSTGRTLTIVRRTVLTNAVSYTFQAGVFGGAAGTSTTVGHPNFAMQLSVTSR